MMRTLPLLISLLLLFAVVFANFYRHVTLDFAPRVLINHPIHLAQRLSLETLPLSSPPVTESVLFLDWDVFVLLPLNLTPGDRTHLTCLFSNGATSPANYTDKMLSSRRHGFLCKMPRSVQRLRRPFYTPRLIQSHSGSGPVAFGSDRATEMMRWTRLAYESYSTVDDVIVFAKGLNRNQGKDRPAADIACVFTVNGVVAAATAATSSSQEVFRCPHPVNIKSTRDDDVRVSIEVAEGSPIPSLAAYLPPPAAAHGTEDKRKALTCACTMVYNAAKFLREWVSYHAAIGVDRFVLYDNGSDDDLKAVLARLAGEGYDVSSVFWPWQKAQEAGFSHCAAAQANACTWMAFFDVDEFLYSPSWADAERPSKSMVGSVIGEDADAERVGQVEFTCADFGPSGQRGHPREGVTQGYTCRLRGNGKLQRHKSIVRLEAVGPSLRNWVHHFEVGPGWGTRKVRGGAVVNHYKYQAWSEFRSKFRRRVSAYVADWRERRNVRSRDRTPGLGFSGEEEPEWWARRRCEVRDVGLKEVVRRGFGGANGRFAWEE